MTASVRSSLVALIAGAGSALGFAPWNYWILTLLACALLLERVYAAPTRNSAWLTGWLFGLGQFIVSLDWIATAFTYQAQMPPSLGIAAVILLSTYLALFPAITCAIGWQWGRANRLRLVLTFAAAWLLTEWLRGVLLTGFPWNPLGVVWLPLAWVARSASLIGPQGLSVLFVIAAGACWCCMRREYGSAMLLCALPAAASIVVAAQSAAPVGESGMPLKSLRIVQPDIEENEKYDTQLTARHAELYARLSGPPQSTARLLLWPEDAVDEDLSQVDGTRRMQIASLLGPEDTLLTGANSRYEKMDGKVGFHNSVFALSASGSLLWRYDKAHLVPFGEYLPLRPLLSRIGLVRLVPGSEDFTPGPGPRTFRIPGFGRVGVQICYEIIFSRRVVDEADRPDFIFNPSDDAWFGAAGPPQHLAQARLRAIEEGLPVLQATPNGISAVIDSTGSLIAKVESQKQGFIETSLPPRAAATIYSKFGAWANMSMCALLIIAAAACRSRYLPVLTPSLQRRLPTPCHSWANTR